MRTGYAGRWAASPLLWLRPHACPSKTHPGSCLSLTACSREPFALFCLKSTQDSSRDQLLPAPPGLPEHISEHKSMHSSSSWVWSIDAHRFCPPQSPRLQLSSARAASQHAWPCSLRRSKPLSEQEQAEGRLKRSHMLSFPVYPAIIH